MSRLEAVTARYNQMRAEIDRIIESQQQEAILRGGAAAPAKGGG